MFLSHQHCIEERNRDHRLKSRNKCRPDRRGLRSIQPDVVPVGFDFEGDYFYVGGMNLLKSTKYKNVLRNNKVAIVIDDLKSIDPWEPRGLKVYGTADVMERKRLKKSQVERMRALNSQLKTPIVISENLLHVFTNQIMKNIN